MRHKGVKGVKTRAFEMLGNYILEKGSIRYIAELEKLDGKDFIDAYTRMVQYFRPRLSSAEVKADIKTDAINLVVDSEVKKLLEDE